MKPPMGMDAEVRVSIAMLRDGTAAGIVVKHLEKQGIPKHVSKEVVAFSQSVVHRRERFIASGICLFGVSILVLGFAAIVVPPLFGFRALVRNAIYLCMFGLMIGMYGLFDAFRKRS